MSARFTPQLEVLPTAQRHLWESLRPALGLGFVLYGGTALALRLGHRSSVDFDFFTDRPLERTALENSFPFIANATILQDRPTTLTILVSNGNAVKVSFFGEIGFGRIGEPATTIDGVMQVASLDDLMATKLKVLLQRVEAKDYRDIAAMLKAGVSLERGLASARAIFGRGFQPSESLKALVYFEGGDLDTLSETDKRILIDEARSVDRLPHIEVISTQLAVA